jgi:hypothetical protein
VTEFLAVTLEYEDASRQRLNLLHARGLYVDDLRRMAQGWRIMHRTLTRKSYDVTNPDCPAQTVERGNSLYVDDFVRTNAGWRIRRRVTAQKNLVIDDVEYAPELIEAFRLTSRTRWF